MEKVKDIQSLPAEEKPFVVGKRIFEHQDLVMVWSKIEVGAKIDSHIHENGDQYFYILRGEGQIMIDGEQCDLGAGSAAYIPRGTEHSFVNTGNEPLERISFLRLAVKE